MTREARQAFLSACYEYLLVVAPVALYVLLDAMHLHGISFFFHSPEWSIAIIFLSFQGISLYLRDLGRTQRKLSEGALGLLALATLIVIVAASINAYESLQDNTYKAIMFRLCLLASVSVTFILFVSGGKLVLSRAEKHRNGS